MVVKTTEFVTPEGLGGYRKTAEVRREVFTPPFPAATGVVCEGLAKVGARIAVEAVAVRGLR
jgi:enamine deaminase RidA (YjgF/YER057c/UK114 family)